MSTPSNNSVRCSSSYVLYSNRQVRDHSLLAENDNTEERDHAAIQIWADPDEEYRFKNVHSLIFCVIGFFGFIVLVAVIYHVTK